MSEDALSEALRAVLMPAAVSLAASRLVSQGVVDTIRKGRGAYDTASDCVALSSLFIKNAQAIRGKTSVTAEEIRQAAEVGSALVKVLKPEAGRRSRERTGAVKQAAEARDRLWTLLVQRHDNLWRAGAYLFGREVDTLVPALQSRVVARKRAKAPAGPTAPTAPAAPVQPVQPAG